MTAGPDHEPQADAPVRPRARRTADIESRLFETTPDLLAVAGFDGYFHRVNRRWTDLLGWSAEELLTTPFAELLFHPDDVLELLAVLERLRVEGGRVDAYELRLRTKVGDHRWVSANATADRDEQVMYLVVQDVHQRHCVENELRFEIAVDNVITRMSTRLLVAAGESLSAAVRSVLAELGEVFHVDHVFWVMLDEAGTAMVTAEEWRSQRMPAPLRPLPATPPDEVRWWAAQVRGGRVVHYAEPVAAVDLDPSPLAYRLRRDGTRLLVIVPIGSEERVVGHIGVSARSTEHPLPAHAIGLLRVVGEACVTAVQRDRWAQALAAALGELEHRNRELERSNRDLEDFAYVASHDLKSPLLVVHGFLDVLRRTKGDQLDDEARSYVEASLRGAERMNRLIDDLLAYSRAGRGLDTTTAVDLGAVLDKVLDELAPEIEAAGATIDCGELPVVVGDEVQLGQVFRNLLANAVKFSRPGVAPVVSVAALRSEGWWRIVVTDNGIGIPPTARSTVFAMFTRLHDQRSFPGTGIGLAICQRVVLAHGGDIAVEDAPGGVGSRFVVTLPA